jgi:hypothetical protein
MAGAVRGLGWRTISGAVGLVLPALAHSGCGACGAWPPATAHAALGAAEAAGGSPRLSFARSDNLAPERWLVLGPFVQDGASRDAALDHDYLAPVGGEATSRIEASTTLEVGGQHLRAAELAADVDRVVDLQALYKDDTDLKVAYGEIESPRDEVVQASFGSDDGAAVWVNGERVHRLVTVGRPVSPDADHFEVALRAGTNRVLVKVENGNGGWGFALSVLDADGQELERALAERRHLEGLELGPESEHVLLEGEFPRLAYRRADEARVVFGDARPKVRWFDPDLREVERREKPGRYIAVVEQASTPTINSWS